MRSRPDARVRISTLWVSKFLMFKAAYMKEITATALWVQQIAAFTIVTVCA